MPVFTLLAIASFAIMLVSTLLAIVARYLRLEGFNWCYEVAEISFIWVTFLGAVAAEQHNENVGFDALRQQAGTALRRFLDGLAILVLAVMGATLLASGVAVLQLQAFVPTPLLRWPSAVIESTVPICGASLLAIAALRLVARGRRRRRRS